MRAGADGVALRRADRGSDTALDRCPVRGVVPWRDCIPEPCSSDVRIAYVCAEMNSCMPAGPISVKPKPMPVSGFGGPH